MSSFWLTLKQQWTIKISSPFLLFLAWRPSWLEVGITLHNFKRGPSKDHTTKVWLQLAQWFLRRRLKCEMLTDERRTMDDRGRTKSDDNSSQARWAKNGTDYSKKYFGYKWTPATTIHNYTNSNNGKSLFIDVLHFSHHRDFKNEHNSYPQMSGKRTLDYMQKLNSGALYFCRWTLHLVISIVLMSFGVYNFISHMF